MWVVNNVRFDREFLISCCKYSVGNLLIDPSHLCEKVKDLFSGSRKSSQQVPPSSNQWRVITDIDILIRNINTTTSHHPSTPVFSSEHNLRPKDKSRHWPVHRRDSQEERPLRLLRRGPVLPHPVRVLRVLREGSEGQVEGGERERGQDQGQRRLRAAELDQHQQRNPQWPFRRLCWGEKDPLFYSIFFVTFSKSLDWSRPARPGKI